MNGASGWEIRAAAWWNGCFTNKFALIALKSWEKYNTYWIVELTIDGAETLDFSVHPETEC